MEGYTSAFHIAILAGLISLDFPPIYAAQIINGMAAIGVILITLIVASKLRVSKTSKLITVLTVAGTPSLATWVMGGLEAVVVSFWLIAGLAAVLMLAVNKKQTLSPLILAVTAFSAAVLTRLDSSVFIVGVGLGLLLCGAASPRKRLLMAAFVVVVPAAELYFKWVLEFMFIMSFFH